MAKLGKSSGKRTSLQLKFEFALWTLAIIRELIRREFNIRLSEVCRTIDEASQVFRNSLCTGPDNKIALWQNADGRRIIPRSRHAPNVIIH